MVVCTYCRKERPFWAVDEDGTGDYSAHIVSGTNAFVDTAGKRMRFRFCPMCGRPLTNPPDDGGGGRVWDCLHLPGRHIAIA